MMKTNKSMASPPNRRAALATLAAAASTLPAALSAAPIASGAPDPIFELIARHRHLTRISSQAHEEWAAADAKYPDTRGWWTYSYGNDSKPPKDGPEPADWMAAQLASHDADTAMEAAATALFTTKPTTIEGIAAVLEYAMRPAFSDPDMEKALDWDCTVLGNSLEFIPTAEAASGFLSTIAQALRDMTAKASS